MSRAPTIPRPTRKRPTRGFDPDFGDDYHGTFVVWGSNRDQVDGYGNAVSPPVGEWIGLRLRAVLHAEPGAD